MVTFHSRFNVQWNVRPFAFANRIGRDVHNKRTCIPACGVLNAMHIERRVTNSARYRTHPLYPLTDIVCSYAIYAELHAHTIVVQQQRYRTSASSSIQIKYQNYLLSIDFFFSKLVEKNEVKSEGGEMFRLYFYKIKIIGVVFSIVIEHAALSFILVTSARMN